jgi:hypothetical protein
MALSKGLILTLNITKTSEQLKSSHGLDVKNWNIILKNKDFENLEITVGEGTFSELIEATQNINYLKSNSSAINFKSSLKAPQKGDIVQLKQLIQYYPDLDKEFFSWLNEKLIYSIVREIKYEGDYIKVKVQGSLNEEKLEKLFPKEFCPDKKYEIINQSTLISYKQCNYYPNITQRWLNTLDIGDCCVIPALPKDIGLNLLGGMYMISYVFGMMARYFPASWISIKRIEKGDKIYPFVFRILEFIEKKFPRQVMDFLNSPYEFEKS